MSTQLPPRRPQRCRPPNNGPVPSSGVYIRFDHYPRALRLHFEDDHAIERARKYAEEKLGTPLPIDPRTNFPAFTLYRDGEEVGGG
jgi:hypothetical protein